jgi:hypothetical protein
VTEPEQGPVRATLRAHRVRVPLRVPLAGARTREATLFREDDL